MNINELWDSIIEYGYNIRKISIQTKNDFDIGQKGWQLLKENFSNYEFEIDNQRYDKLDCINELKGEYIKSEDDKEHENVKIKIEDIILDNTKEHEHFFIQHFRISKTVGDKLSVQKLMQIAYNIGQFKATKQFDNKYNLKIINYYETNNLDKLETFIRNSKKIKIIKKVQKGGVLLYKFNRNIFF
jgi:hypothetical protein